MTLTRDLPIVGLDREIPEELFVVLHASSRRYGCFCHQGIHGLAAFSSRADAERFRSLIELTGLYVVPIEFDQARQVAKERPMPVVALLLLDDLADPIVHYVR
ncbi:hypothetical protein EON79_18990 [bacterium]|nr:MAG: hypothetical protein EON79_18990 [bacterium]